MNNNVNNRSAQKVSIAKAEWLVLAAATTTSLALIGWVLWRSHFGIDFTDESFYLVWISNPWLYKVSVSQFGFLYHPLYQLVGGDITALRQVNILITFGLAWMLCVVFIRSLTAIKEIKDSWRGFKIVGISFVLSTSSLVFLDLWRPTPSYNSLALQALLVAGSGILLAEANTSRSSLIGWVLIGLAGWLALMAKPTTAAALGLVVGVYLLLTGKLRIRLLAVSLIMVTALSVATALIIDGSIDGFVTRLINSVEDVKRLGGRHTLSDVLRWDSFSLGRTENLTLVVTTLLVFLAVYFGFSAQPSKRLIWATLVIIFSFGPVLLLTGVFHPEVAPLKFQGLQMWAAPLGALLAAFVMWHKNLATVMSPGCLALAVCFAAFPHVYAFGAGANHWSKGSNAALFWVLAGITILGSINTSKNAWQGVLSVATGAQAITIALLYIGMEHPQRQTQALRLNQDVVQITQPGSELRVSRPFADYIRNLTQIAKQNGFKPGEPMIDLTGHYPGALFAIGAKSIGLAWMIGGYKGSEKFAIAALDRVSCEELGKAWVLTEPSGPRKLPPDMLKRYGINLSRDYLEAGALSSPAGSYRGSFEQRLLKPARHPEDAQSACESRRETAS